MQTSTEKNDKGGIPGKVTRPVIIETLSENIKLSDEPCTVKYLPFTLSHPALCQRCDGECHIQPDGPDAGRLFACGIMMENIREGCMSFACPYFKPSIAPIIDSETANAALSLRAAAESIEPCFNPQRWLAERGL